jgi:short-subunit dehydrogenase
MDQLARMNKLNITFTDIRPGFVATPLLKDRNYPLLMNVTDVAEEIIQSIERKKRVAIIDWKYRILVAFWRMIPNWIWLRLPVKN